MLFVPSDQNWGHYIRTEFIVNKIYCWKITPQWHEFSVLRETSAFQSILLRIYVLCVDMFLWWKMNIKKSFLHRFTFSTLIKYIFHTLYNTLCVVTQSKCFSIFFCEVLFTFLIHTHRRSSIFNPHHKKQKNKWRGCFFMRFIPRFRYQDDSTLRRWWWWWWWRPSLEWF